MHVHIIYIYDVHPPGDDRRRDARETAAGPPAAVVPLRAATAHSYPHSTDLTPSSSVLATYTHPHTHIYICAPPTAAHAQTGIVVDAAPVHRYIVYPRETGYDGYDDYDDDNHGSYAILCATTTATVIRLLLYIIIIIYSIYIYVPIAV